MRKYLFVLITLAVLTFLMSLPDVANIAITATLGLAFPVVFAATGLLYALCAAPLVVTWNEGHRDRAVGAAVAAALVAMVALLPSYLGRREAEPRALRRLASDFVKREPARPPTIEIRHPAVADA